MLQIGVMNSYDTSHISNGARFVNVLMIPPTGRFLTPMNPDIGLSPAIRRILRYVEWALIAIVTLNSILIGDLSVVPGSAFLAAFALLSFIFPMHRPLWQRGGYIALGLLLVLFAYSLGIDFNVFLYLYVAKSCFLLERKSVIAIVIIIGIISTPIYVGVLPKMLQSLSSQTANPYNLSQSQKFTLNYLGNYLAGNTFAMLFSLMVIAEQKSRQRAETLSQQVESLAIALERTRIARDIHDSLGHTLTNLQVQLAVAQEFRQHHLDQAFRAIDTAKFLADQCIEDISQALQTMRQSDFNLNQALKSLVEQIKQNQALRISWEVNLPHLPLSTSHHVYCIVKEGLLNIQKHAQASIIWVRGQLTTEGIMLEISDNGRGFDPHIPASGFGLKGMEERVYLLGGQFKIHSQPNRGTQIQIVIPYPSRL